MKKDTPEQVVDFSKLDKTAKLAAFIEATKGDDFKDVDLVKELNIKLPEPKVIDTASKNEEAIAKLIPKYEKTRGELVELGHKFETTSQMSEAEKVIYDKIEKQSQASLSEKVADLIKIDADFPSEEVLSKMSIATEDKLVVASAFKEMIVRNSEAVSKIKKELDTAVAELKTAKLASPAKPENDKSGADIVDSKMSTLEFVPEKTPETKTDKEE